MKKSVLRRLANMSISAKMIASFSLIIAIFLAEVFFSGNTSNRIDFLHRHNLDFVVARMEWGLES